jgi:hypothetical protein
MLTKSLGLNTTIFLPFLTSSVNSEGSLTIVKVWLFFHNVVVGHLTMHNVVKGILENVISMLTS